MVGSGAVATAPEPTIVGSQWLGAAANVLLDSSLAESTDEKVAALLEAGCPQTAIDSCLKNFMLAASPAMKDSQWLGGAANVRQRAFCRSGPVSYTHLTLPTT